MRFEAITWDRLAATLADHLTGADERPSPWLRAALDGPPAAGTGELAERLSRALRLRGRTVLVVDAEDFLRPASLRYEFGRQDPHSYYEGWFDTGALWREVFTPLEPGGSGRVLPDLWDPATDRATRSPYVPLPPGGVLLLHGPMLLRHWFPFDLTVHVRLSAAALERRTAPEARWTLPAFARYEQEAAPGEAADVVVRADDPRHPAWTGLRR
ncbi:nucleoside/nucleotide kinase family protein [Streptomyces albidochromogenes]|uniref:Uridine kinase n=1 Tax=Streptomyces albidochromogenes TaxID=329524 RepID=A0ABW6FIX7_9ACTN